MLLITLGLKQMKILIITLSIIISTFPCFSQDRHEVFLIGTSKPNITNLKDDNVRGLIQGNVHISKTSVTGESFVFYIRRNNYIIPFYHWNKIHKQQDEKETDELLDAFGLHREKPHILRIENIKIAELYTFTSKHRSAEIIDIDTFFTDSKGKKDIEKWVFSHLKNKSKIWIIDYSSAYKSSEELDKPDMIKIIEVRLPVFW